MKSYLKNLLCFLGIMIALISIIALISSHSGKNAALPPETPPVRIVSLAPNITEILFAIGLDSEIAGITDECDYPAEKVKSKTRVGSFERPDIEAILQLKPDLIIAGKNSNGIVKKLISLEQNVIYIETDGITKLLDGIKIIGEKTVKTKEADELVNSIRSAIVKTQDKKNSPSDGKTVAIVVTSEPLKLSTDRSYEGDMLKYIGAVNAITHPKAKYIYSNMEALELRKPGIIIDATLPGNLATEQKESRIKFWSGRTSMPAVKDNEIYVIDSELLARPGPRTVQAMETLAEIIHKTR